MIWKLRREIRTWYRLGSASKSEANKALENRKKIFRSLAPFPILFLATWAPLLIDTCFVLAKDDTPVVYSAIAFMLSRLWGLFSCIAYGSSHWRLLVSYFRGSGTGNIYEAQLQVEYSTERERDSTVPLMVNIEE